MGPGARLRKSSLPSGCALPLNLRKRSLRRMSPRTYPRCQIGRERPSSNRHTRRWRIAIRRTPVRRNMLSSSFSLLLGLISGQKNPRLLKSGKKINRYSYPQLRSALSESHRQVSWLLVRALTPAFPPRLVGVVAMLHGVGYTSYSGATAPVSHRLPFSVPISRDHLWLVVNL